MHLIQIDDSTVDAECFARMLQPLNWTVSTFSALDDVPAEIDCDVILLDLRLPPWNSEVRTLQKFRQLRLGKPLIVRTGFATEAVQDLAEAYGVLAVLSKQDRLTTTQVRQAILDAIGDFIRNPDRSEQQIRDAVRVLHEARGDCPDSEPTSSPDPSDVP